MGYKVNTNSLENLSEEVRSLCAIIDDTFVSYCTNNYEILSDMSIEYVDELKVEMEDISNKIDNCVFLLKKHESFLLNSAQEYAELETDIVKNAQSLKNDLYFERKNVQIENSNGEIFETSSDNDFANIISDILPVPPIWNKDFELGNAIDLKDIHLVIDGFNLNVLMPSIGKKLKDLIGLSAVLAPGVFICDIGKIASIFALNFFDFKDFYYKLGGLGLGKIGSLDDLLGIVGSAVQMSYYSIVFAGIEGFMTWLLTETDALGNPDGVENLFTLWNNEERPEDDETVLPVNPKLSDEEEETPDVDNNPKDEDKVNGDSRIKDSVNDDSRIRDSVNEAGAVGGMIYGLDTADNVLHKEKNDSGKKSYDRSRNDYNAGATYSNGYVGGNYAEAECYKNETGGTEKTNTDSGFSATGGQSTQAENVYRKDLTGQVGNNEKAISSDTMGFSIYESVSENDTAKRKRMTGSAEGGIKNSDEWAAYHNSTTVYEKILSQNAKTKNAAESDLGSMGLGLAGTGAFGSATAGLAGMVANGSSIKANVEIEKAVLNVMKCVIGMNEFDNLFDFVGNASRCNIGWLSETMNILMV